MYAINPVFLFTDTSSTEINRGMDKNFIQWYTSQSSSLCKGSM